MKKKLFAMLLTAALVAAQGVTALAAGSAEAGNTVKTPLSSIEVTPVTPGTVEVITGASVAETVDSYLPCTLSAETKEAVKAQLAEAAADGKVDSILKSMSADARKGIRRFTTLGVLDLKPESGSTMTMRITNVPAGVTLYALHLTKDGVWEQISVTRDGDMFTFSSSNWSPVIFGYKEPWVDPDPGHGTSGGGQSSSAETTSAGLVASPKTGVASDWSLWMGGAVALLAAASVMFRKKEA